MNDLIERASALARDLHAKRVDPNEAQKALTYLRAQKDSKAYFAYLQAIVNNGRAVIRSNQTIEYYRNLLEVSQQRLRNLSPPDMVLTLAWAIRLLRYYNAVPEAERQPLDVAHASPPQSIVRPASSPSRPSSTAQPAPARPSPPQSQPAARPAPSPSPAAATEQPAPLAPTSNIPQPGEVFTDTVLEVGDDAVLVQVRNFDQERVVGVMRAETIPDRNTAKYAKGNTARVEVVAVQQKGERIILELKPAPKKKTRS
jgi:hypothetical protein